MLMRPFHPLGGKLTGLQPAAAFWPLFYYCTGCGNHRIDKIFVFSFTRMPRKLQLHIAEALINAVQSRECLYNLRHPYYKNRIKTELAWKAVSNEVGRDETFCRTTWAQMRSTFNRVLSQTKHLPRGSRALREPKWYLYQQMLFIKDHVAHGVMTGSLDDSLLVETALPSPTDSVSSQQTFTSTQSISSDAEIVVETEETVEIVEAEESQGEVGGATEAEAAGGRNEEAAVRPSSKKRKSSCDGDAVQNAFLQLIELKKNQVQTQQGHTSDNVQEDPDLQVFKSLLPFYKQLTNRNKRAFVAQTTTLCMQLIDSQEDL